jgi:hypothetical protein
MPGRHSYGLEHQNPPLIVGLALLAVVMGLYASGPETIQSARRERHCNMDDLMMGNPAHTPCWETPSHRAAAWERVWFAVVGE